MTDPEPVHRHIGTLREVEQANQRQRVLTAAILEVADVDSVDELVDPRKDEQA